MQDEDTWIRGRSVRQAELILLHLCVMYRPVLYWQTGKNFTGRGHQMGDFAVLGKYFWEIQGSCWTVNQTLATRLSALQAMNLISIAQQSGDVSAEMYLKYSAMGPIQPPSMAGVEQL